MTPRVVVTGTGIITSIGAGIDAFAEALFSGRCGIARDIPTSSGPVVAAGIQNFSSDPWLGAKGVRVLDRSARLLCVAAHMALENARLAETAEADPELNLGLACGTMFGSVRSITAFDWSGVTDGTKYVNPMDFPNTVINSPAGQAAIRFKLRGVNSTLCAGLASGVYAMHYASEFLRLGRADALLAGGVEEFCEESYLGFQKNGLASPRGKASPFAPDRDGTVVGEGSALWVLETEAGAAKRGATPSLEICGFGAAQDAYSITAFQPRAHGAISAINEALRSSGIGPEAIAVIIASASGSRAGDAMEARALANVFGGRLAEIPISAPKASFGEAMGAAGAMLAIAGALALQRQTAPPTAGFVGAEWGLRMSAEPQPVQGEYALINCFGCDGNNASLVLKRR